MYMKELYSNFYIFFWIKQICTKLYGMCARLNHRNQFTLYSILNRYEYMFAFLFYRIILCYFISHVQCHSYILYICVYMIIYVKIITPKTY